MKPNAPTKRPCPRSGVQTVDTPAVIKDPVPKDRKKGTQGMTPYITPDGSVLSPVNFLVGSHHRGMVSKAP